MVNGGLFSMANAILDRLPGPNPWYLTTGHHGGWGTYYLEFRLLGSLELTFAVSEEGHFAGGHDFLDYRAVQDFNLRVLLERGGGPTKETIGRFVEAASRLLIGIPGGGSATDA